MGLAKSKEGEKGKGKKDASEGPLKPGEAEEKRVITIDEDLETIVDIIYKSEIPEIGTKGSYSVNIYDTPVNDNEIMSQIEIGKQEDNTKVLIHTNSNALDTDIVNSDTGKKRKNSMKMTVIDGMSIHVKYRTVFPFPEEDSAVKRYTFILFKDEERGEKDLIVCNGLDYLFVTKKINEVKKNFGNVFYILTYVDFGDNKPTKLKRESSKAEIPVLSHIDKESRDAYNYPKELYELKPERRNLLYPCDKNLRIHKIKCCDDDIVIIWAAIVSIMNEKRSSVDIPIILYDHNAGEKSKGKTTGDIVDILICDHQPQWYKNRMVNIKVTQEEGEEATEKKGN